MTVVTQGATPRLHTPRRLLAAENPGLEEHLRVHGALVLPRARSIADLLGEVRAARSTGRGGAGRPVADAFDAVRDGVATTGRPAVVVANGVEGEPVSRKDVTLLTRAPHLVLDGLDLAAAVVGADAAVLCAAEGPGLAAVRTAVAERRRHRRGGVAVTVVPSAPGFVAGQDTAVVAHLNGAAPVPRGDGVPLSRNGVHGRPTLVKNVETLAQLALVGRHGARGIASLGTPENPGTLLTTVAVTGAEPRVVEVAWGTPLRSVLAVTGGPVSAALVGGFHGSWIGGDELDVPLSPSALAGVRASVGAGVLLALRPGECGLRATERVLVYLAGQSVRQCGPCRFGLPGLAERFSAVLDGRGGGEELGRSLTLLQGRGACRHPDASAAMLASTVRVFAADLAAHRAGRCTVAGTVAA
ncbi:NADH-ubiquinone oxidoreductase-F iron-sulfur binding region domain-containing protein [Kineococcus gynurae]|uniref:NADH-ubiquinone oxidoreductase-F iron-sulfur binding region domain-containing protein n=1 Tax=Kineococcus gynurae TaxID=452979 RepID=A0ABV5LP50_9ACTN